MNYTYINFVGPDGSGKDTIYKKIIEDYKDVIQHREPGGTKEAEVIREVLLSPDFTKKDRIKKLDELLKNKQVTETVKEYLEKAKKEIEERDITGLAEVYLFAASRAQSNETLVLPAIKEKKFVFGRRSIACSMSYQAYAREKELKACGIEDPVTFIWKENQKALRFAMPHLEILFDIPTEIAMERLSGRTEKSDRLDQESEEFHRKTREGYLKYYQEFCPYPYEIVDASKSIEEVYKSVKEILEKYI